MNLSIKGFLYFKGNLSGSLLPHSDQISPDSPKNIKSGSALENRISSLLSVSETVFASFHSFHFQIFKHDSPFSNAGLQGTKLKEKLT